MGELLRRFHYLLHRRRLDAELESEMELHREMARRQGRLDFGNTLCLREQAQDAWGWTGFDRFLQDMRWAGRGLRRAPGSALPRSRVARKQDLVTAGARAILPFGA